MTVVRGLRLYFITSNLGKFEEAKRKLEKYGIELEWIRRKVEEPRGEDVKEVARKTMERLLSEERLPEYTFLEDAGLFIRSLKGFPGPYSAYVFSKIGYQGILKLMEGVKDRYAEFRAAIALWDGREIRIFEGKCPGKISEEAKGTGGFGYDPIFVPEGYEKTFAEMEQEKDKISHRAKAIEGMVRFLREELRMI